VLALAADRETRLLIFPIRDENPSGTRPVVTVAIIAVNALVFLYELSLGEGAGEFLATYGVVPASVLGGEDAGVAVGDGIGVYFPFLTAMFLHGGWGHLLGNMWFLWLAGDNIEDRIGHVAFVFFYLAAGVAASIAHVLLSGPSTVPMVGASGAISGVLGAYLVCFPRAKVVTLIWIFIFIHFARLPAMVLIGMWFLLQLVSAAMSNPNLPGVAWWAHIGGFVAGVVLIILWPKCRRAKQSKYEAIPDRWRHRAR
jgi:membrane associated rhomboid family serine protease